MHTSKSDSASVPLRKRDRFRIDLERAKGILIEYDIGAYREIAARIRRIDLARKGDEELTDMSRDIRARIGAGGETERELEIAFALVAEACRRRLGFDPYDEQIVAGIVMQRGKLAQMRTGEGKTLAAVFAASLGAMRGEGMHVMTANDYLARRDAIWMGPVYGLLGLEVAHVGAEMDVARRAAAYDADVTYLSAREAGFDYLRDQLAWSREEVVQRPLATALVDEADSIMIDEARVPLVIATSLEDEGVDLAVVDRLARGLRPGQDYEVDREGRRVSLSLRGLSRIEDELGVGGMEDRANANAYARIYASLHAHCLLRRDVDYVVKNGGVEPVDEFTGRVAEGRRWPWGVHAALQAKESLIAHREGRIGGSISVEHFLGLYGKLSAMTATALPSAQEFMETYGLATVLVPPARPSLRIDLADAVFATRGGKELAVRREIAEAHRLGRPVLVGTASIGESEELAESLRSSGIPCEVLNAKNDEREAAIIAEAGRPFAVTISTNMAGRGTDIRLGGSAGVREREESIRLGGLYVIGTGRHESGRVDDQLRGRAGRQGEPGTTRFFVSLEDPLFERYGVRDFLPRQYRTTRRFDGARPPSDQGSVAAPFAVPRAEVRAAKEVMRAQRIAEARNHSIRRSLRKYSLLVEFDRRFVRELRDDALLRGELPAELEADAGVAALRRNAAAYPSFGRGPDPASLAFMHCLDEFWSSHLAFLEDLREGIELERYGGRDPGLEYLRKAAERFERGLDEAFASTIALCGDMVRKGGTADLAGLGIKRASGSWTYQVEEESLKSPGLATISSANVGIAPLLALPLLLIDAFESLAERIAGFFKEGEG